MALQRPLASLAGRLELLVAHMPRVGAAGADDADAAGPLVRRALVPPPLLLRFFFPHELSGKGVLLLSMLATCISVTVFGMSVPSHDLATSATR